MNAGPTIWFSKATELHALTTKLKFRPDDEHWKINSLSEIDILYNNDNIVEPMSLYMCSHLQYSYLNIFISILSYIRTTPYAYNGIIK